MNGCARLPISPVVRACASSSLRSPQWFLTNSAYLPRRGPPPPGRSAGTSAAGKPHGTEAPRRGTYGVCKLPARQVNRQASVRRGASGRPNALRRVAQAGQEATARAEDRGVREVPAVSNEGGDIVSHGIIDRQFRLQIRVGGFDSRSRLQKNKQSWLDFADRVVPGFGHHFAVAQSRPAPGAHGLTRGAGRIQSPCGPPSRHSVQPGAWSTVFGPLNPVGLLKPFPFGDVQQLRLLCRHPVTDHACGLPRPDSSACWHRKSSSGIAAAKRCAARSARPSAVASANDKGASPMKSLRRMSSIAGWSGA